MALHEECILFLLAKAFQRAHGTAKANLRPYGITPEQQLVLATVAEMEGSSAGEVGRALRMDSATISGILERMSEKGLIEKQPDPDDKRVVRLHPTEDVRRLVPRLIEERDRLNQEVLASLTHEERVLLKRMLREIG